MTDEDRLKLGYDDLSMIINLRKKYTWLDCKFKYLNGALMIKHHGVLTTVKHFKERYPNLW